MDILATRRSIGGQCQWCGRAIARNEPVSRVDDGKPRTWTVAGTGPGSWVCAECASLAARQLSLFPREPQTDG